MTTPMSESVILHPTPCAICGTEGNAETLYAANFSLTHFNAAVFSARRLPDRIHYQMVRCLTCGLVRSDPVAVSDVLAQLYRESTFDYGAEVTNLRTTYGEYLSKLDAFKHQKDALLEIGSGNGFFLNEALRQGYAEVCGVEPSQAAIDAAEPSIRPFLVCDVMHSGLFPPNHFDVICLFQVFDHIPDPTTLLADCFEILKPGGLVLCFNHNVTAFSARLFGERSPIIDIEHTYLYNPATITRLFEQQSYHVLRAAPARNVYTLHYLSRLLPLPGVFKQVLLNSLKQGSIGQIKLWVSLGNLYMIAQKPPKE